MLFQGEAGLYHMQENVRKTYWDLGDLDTWQDNSKLTFKNR